MGRRKRKISETSAKAAPPKKRQKISQDFATSLHALLTTEALSLSNLLRSSSKQQVSLRFEKHLMNSKRGSKKEDLNLLNLVHQTTLFISEEHVDTIPNFERCEVVSLQTVILLFCLQILETYDVSSPLCERALLIIRHTTGESDEDSDDDPLRMLENLPNPPKIKEADGGCYPFPAWCDNDGFDSEFRVLASARRRFLGMRGVERLLKHGIQILRDAIENCDLDDWQLDDPPAELKSSLQRCKSICLVATYILTEGNHQGKLIASSDFFKDSNDEIVGCCVTLMNLICEFHTMINGMLIEICDESNADACLAHIIDIGILLKELVGGLLEVVENLFLNDFLQVLFAGTLQFRLLDNLDTDCIYSMISGMKKNTLFTTNNTNLDMEHIIVCRKSNKSVTSDDLNKRFSTAACQFLLNKELFQLGIEMCTRIRNIYKDVEPMGKHDDSEPITVKIPKYATDGKCTLHADFVDFEGKVEWSIPDILTLFFGKNGGLWKNMLQLRGLYNLKTLKQNTTPTARKKTRSGTKAFIHALQIRGNLLSKLRDNELVQATDEALGLIDTFVEDEVEIFVNTISDVAKDFDEEVLVGCSISSLILLVNPFESIKIFAKDFITALVTLIRLRPDKDALFSKILRGCLNKSGSTISLQTPPCVLQFLCELIKHMSQNCVTKMLEALWKSRPLLEKFNNTHIRFWTHVCSISDAKNASIIVKHLLALFEESMGSSLVSGGISLGLLLNVLSSEKPTDSCDLLDLKKPSIPGIPLLDPNSKKFKSVAKLLKKRQSSLMEHLRKIDAEIKKCGKPTKFMHTLICQLSYILSIIDTPKSKLKGKDEAHTCLLSLFHALRYPNNTAKSNTYSEITEVLRKCLEAYKSRFDKGNGSSAWWVNICVIISCHALFQRIIHAFPNRDQKSETTHDHEAHALLVSIIMDLIDAYRQHFVAHFNQLPKSLSSRGRTKAAQQTVQNLVDQWDPNAKIMPVTKDMKEIELRGLKPDDVIHKILSTHLEVFPQYIAPRKKGSKSSKAKVLYAFLSMEKIGLAALLKLTMALIHFDKEGFVEEDSTLNNRFSTVIGGMAGNNYFKFIEAKPHSILRLVEEYYDCTDIRLQAKFYRMKVNFQILSLICKMLKTDVSSHYRVSKDTHTTINSNVPSICDSLLAGLTPDICASLFKSVFTSKEVMDMLFTTIRLLKSLNSKIKADMGPPIVKLFQVWTKIINLVDDNEVKLMCSKFFDRLADSNASKLVHCLDLPYVDVADFFFAILTREPAQGSKFSKKMVDTLSRSIAGLMKKQRRDKVDLIFEVFMLFAVASRDGSRFYSTIQTKLFNGDFTCQPPTLVAKMFQLFRIINAIVDANDIDSLDLKKFEPQTNAKPPNVCTEVNRDLKSTTMYHCQKCNMTICHICALRCHQGHTVTRSRLPDIDECHCGSSETIERTLVGNALSCRKCNAQAEISGLTKLRNAAPVKDSGFFITRRLTPKMIKKAFGSSKRLNALEELIESMLDTINKKQHGVVVRNDESSQLTHKVEQVFKLRQSSPSLSKVDGSNNLRAFDFAYPPALLNTDQYGCSPPLNVVELLNDGCIALADKTFMRVLKMKSLLNPDHYQVHNRRSRTSVQLLIRTEFTFSVNGIRKNPLNESYVAVYGHHHCQVVVLQTTYVKSIRPKRDRISTSGDETKNMTLHVQNRISLELGLEEIEAEEDGSYYLIISVDWLPNWQTKVAVTTNRDVRIFDLTKTNLSPEITMMLPNNLCIASSTFVYNSDANSLSMYVLSQEGAKLYLITNLHELCGHVTLDKTLQVHNKRDVEGLCVYYSPITNRLIVSATKKNNFLITLDKSTAKALKTEAFPQDPNSSRILKENFCRWVEISPTSSGVVPIVGQISSGQKSSIPSKRIIVVYVDPDGKLVSIYQPNLITGAHLSFQRQQRLMAIIDASAVNNSPGNFLTLQSDGAVTIHGPSCKSPQDVKVSWDPIKSWLQGFEASKSNTDPTVLQHASKVPMGKLSLSGDFEGSNRQAGRMVDPEERSTFMKSTNLHRLRLNISVQDKNVRIVCVRVKIDRLVHNSHMAPTTIRLNGQNSVSVKPSVNWYDLFVPLEDAAPKITLTCEKPKHTGKNSSYRARVGGGYFSFVNDATTDTKGVGIEGIEVYTMSMRQIKDHFSRVQEWTTPAGISKDKFRYGLLNCIRNLAKRNLKKTENMISGILSETLLRRKERIQFNTSSGMYEVHYRCGITERFNSKIKAEKALRGDQIDCTMQREHFTHWSPIQVRRWVASIPIVKQYASKFEERLISGQMLDEENFAMINGTVPSHLLMELRHRIDQLRTEHESPEIPQIPYKNPLAGLPKSEILGSIENLFLQRPQTTNSFGLYYEDDMSQLDEVLRSLMKLEVEKQQLSANSLLFIFQTIDRIAFQRRKHLVDYPDSRELHFTICAVLMRVFKERVTGLVSSPVAYLAVQVLVKCLIPYCHNDATLIPDVFLCVSFALLCPFKQVSIVVAMYFCDFLIADGFAKQHWTASLPKQSYAPSLKKLKRPVKKKPRADLFSQLSNEHILLKGADKSELLRGAASKVFGHHGLHDRLLSERAFESRNIASWRCDVCSQTITGARFRCADYSCSSGSKPGDGFDTCQECWENINDNPDDFKSSNHLLSHFVLQMPAKKPTDMIGNANIMMRRHFAPLHGLVGHDREKLISLVHKKTLSLSNNVSKVKNDKKNDKLQLILFNAAVQCFTPDSDAEDDKEEDAEMEETEVEKKIFSVVMATEGSDVNAQESAPSVKLPVANKEEEDEKEEEDGKEDEEKQNDGNMEVEEASDGEADDEEMDDDEGADDEMEADDQADDDDERELSDDEDDSVEICFTDSSLLPDCHELLKNATGISLVPYLKVLFCIVINGNEPQDIVRIFRAILDIVRKEILALQERKLETSAQLVATLELFQKITVLAACLGEMIRALKRKNIFVFMQQIVQGTRKDNEDLVKMLFKQVSDSLDLLEKQALTYVHHPPLLEERQQFTVLSEFFFPPNTWEKRDRSSPIDWIRMMIACISSLLYFLVKSDRAALKLVPEDFQGVLCHILVSKNDFGGHVYRRQIKKLLSVVCGNDKSRHELYDNFVYDGIFKEFHQVCEIEGIGKGVNYSNIMRQKCKKLSFPRLLELSELLTKMEDPCMKRPGLWIKYLSERTSEMTFLYSLTFTIPELATQIIGLLGKPGASVFRNFSGSASETSSDASATSSTQAFLPSLKSVEAFLNSGMLDPFVCNFLLGSRDSKVRQACLQCLLVQWACILNSVVNKQTEAEVQTAQKLALKLFHTLNKWINHAPRYGSQVDSFLDLLVQILVDSSQSVTLLPPEVIGKTMETLLTSTWTQYDLLQQHPCVYLYSRLFSDIISTEESKPHAYYLSTIGCSICHNGFTEESDVQTKDLTSFVAEKKFTHNSKLFTFPEQCWVAGMTIKISPRNRELAKVSSKPVKTILIYLTSECKDISALVEKDWTLAKTINVAKNATEATVDFSVPIKAKALRIEFAAFHLCQSDLDMIVCPRCHGRSAQNGYCTNCGEHVLQCRTCRNINYEHPDAFICNSCGYCRSTIFRFILKARKCLEISAITNEKDRENVVEKISQWTNGVDRILSNMENHRCYLKQFLKDFDDGELSSPSTNTATTSTGRDPLGGAERPERLIFREGRGDGPLSSNNNNKETDPRKKIRNYYETDCRGEYVKLCNTYQRLHSAKEQLALYLGKQNPKILQHSDEILNDTPFNEPCYSCMQSWINKMMDCCEELCHSSVIRNHIIERKVMEELLHRATNYVDATSRKKTCQMLCTIANADEAASQMVLELVNKQIRLCISHVIDLQPSYRTGPCSVPELVSPIRRLMTLVASMFEDANEMVKDKIWEQRIRFAFALLFYAAQHGSKCNVIVQEVIHPCLKVLPHCESSSIVNQNIVSPSPQQPKSPAPPKGRAEAKRNKEPSRMRPGQARAVGSARLSPIMKARASSEVVAPLNEMKPLKLPPSLSDVQDPTKYGQWLGNLCFEEWDTSSSPESKQNSPQSTWIRSCLLNPLSQDVRDETALLLRFLMKLEDTRVELFLDILLDTLRDDDIHQNHGENASEFFELLTTQMASPSIRKYLLSNHILDRIITMITREVDVLNAKETKGRSLLINMSAIGPKPVNPAILLGLCKLLRSCLASSTNILKDNDTHIQHLVEAFLRTQELVLQKTKVSVECADILRHVVEDVFCGSEADQKKMILVYMAALKKFLEEDEMRIPIFILKHICDIIQPAKQEAPWSIVFLKDPKCDEFIRGNMKHRSYAAKDFKGLTMKAVQQKIAQELGTVGETGELLELLVNDKIIDTELPISGVVEKVWRISQNEDEMSDRSPEDSQLTPMVVVYRISGLNGEATEDIVKELPPDDENDKNPEEVFSICHVMRESNSLRSLVDQLKNIKNLDNTVTLNFATLLIQTLTFCAKLNANRHHLVAMDAVSCLLNFLPVVAKAPQPGKLMQNLLVLINYLLVSYDNLVDSWIKSYPETEGLKIAMAQVPKEELMDANKKAVVPVTLSQEALVTYLSKTQGVSASRFEDVRLSELKEYLDFVVDRINSNVNVEDQQIELMINLLPYLTYRQAKLTKYVLRFFEPHIDWDHMESTGEAKKLLFWFVKLCEGLGSTGSCTLFRNHCLDGVTVITATYIVHHLSGVKKVKKQERIELANSKKALPLVLRCLTGLSREHKRTQKLMRKLNVIKPVHALEKDSTSTQIGPLCECLLEAISRKNQELKKYIKNLRQKVRDKKKRKAMKRRQKMLDEMQVRKVPKLNKDADASSASHDMVRLVSSVKVDGADEIMEESSTLKCMVCREGYTCQPDSMLGIYVYNKTVDGRRSSLITNEARLEDSLTDDFSISTVSHFHMIHFNCHKRAKTADSNMKPPRKEWEGAQLRNSRTLCNNLFPIANPSLKNNSMANSSYYLAAETYWNNIRSELLQVDRLFCSKFEIQLDDLRMLLKRFSHKASFSEDCHGGGAVSNMQFVPYMSQLMCHFFDKLEAVISKRMFLLFEERNNSALLDLTQQTCNFNIETQLDIVTFLLSLVN